VSAQPQTAAGFSAEVLARLGSDARGRLQIQGEVAPPVGSYRPNPYGLFDIHGNVREWCRDGFDSKFLQRGVREDPEREPGDKRNRSARGGSHYSSAPYTRSAHRGGFTPETGAFDLGIRPVRRLNP
jgi:formylglycine-generating enzyme required for sulfatase activity